MVSKKLSKSTYAEFLKEKGDYVITVDEIDWYCYQGFMMPACLPHCVPEISEGTAKKVLKILDRQIAIVLVTYIIFKILLIYLKFLRFFNFVIDFIILKFKLKIL